MIPKTASIESLLLKKKKLSGEYRPPADKSITHRGIFLGALSEKSSRIKNPLGSGDCLSTFKTFSQLGVRIRKGKNEWMIEKGKRNAATKLREFKAPSAALDCGNSGTTMRLLSGLLSAQDFKARLIGDASLSKRPMKRVIEPLFRMGARIRSTVEGTAPLEITGNPGLRSIDWTSAVASAQVKSSILLAGLFAKGRTSVTEPEKSRDHTERMLESMGARIRYKKAGDLLKENSVSIEGGTVLDGLNFTVPGDFSSAAFFIAAALLVPKSDLTILNVNLNPTRTGFLDVIRRMGAKVIVEKRRDENNEPIGNLRVRHSELKGVEVRPAEIPLLIDEIPILSVLATQASGRTEISGAGELRVKESDRLAAVAAELKKMSANIVEKKDGLIIEGPTPLSGAVVRSYHDHRMAMSLAVAGLITGKWITMIEDFDCIAISFPSFWDDLQGLIS